MHIQIGLICLENREADLLACAAGRPLHNVDDVFGIKLHFNVQIAGRELSAVLDALDRKCGRRWLRCGLNLAERWGNAEAKQ